MTDEASPSAKLAALTVDRLIASGLVRAGKRDGLINKISAGSMSSSDWKLELELTVAKAAS